MTKGIILYESRYGAAKQYAGWLSKALQIPAMQTSQIPVGQLATYDFIIAGSSIYMGKILIKDWLYKNVEVLKNKKVLFYIVGAAPATQQEKTAKYFTDNIPPALLNSDNQFYLQGKSLFKELGLADKFFLKMGAWLAKTPEDKKAMLTDFNAVQQQNLTPILNAVPKLFCEKVKEKNMLAAS